jgi:uncharacterized protein (TIGR03000 family)
MSVSRRLLLGLVLTVGLFVGLAEVGRASPYLGRAGFSRGYAYHGYVHPSYFAHPGYTRPYNPYYPYRWDRPYHPYYPYYPYYYGGLYSPYYYPYYWYPYYAAYPYYSYAPSYTVINPAPAVPPASYAPAAATPPVDRTGPQVTAPANAAAVRVLLPDPNAQLYFDGVLTSSRGRTRGFVTPVLQPGQNYQYTVRAVWMQDGQERSEERTVRVSAGQTVVVDFTRPG